MRVLIGARELINTERTREINALTALVRIVDLAIDARSALSRNQIATIAAWRPRHEEVGTDIARREAIRLAKRIRACDDELAVNCEQLTTLVESSDGAHLLKQPGIGAVNAATLIAVWSHGGRIRSEAAFAVLSGTSSLPGPSGNTSRH